MQVILLERIAKLGQMGDEVNVKNGYARNYLLPTGKALRASDANRARFEREKSQLEARNLELRKEAEAVGAKLDGRSFTAIRSAGETGQLYGSVSPRDIVEIAAEDGIKIQRNQIRQDRPIKTIGIHQILISLHPEVEVPITLNVARSNDEADRQAAGEDLTARDRFEEAAPEPEEAEEAPDVEEFFENIEDAEAAKQAETGELEAAEDVPSDGEDGGGGDQADAGSGSESAKDVAGGESEEPKN